MIRRAAAPMLAALVTASAVWGWVEIDRLRGTPLWEFRYIALGVATILALGVANWIAGWIDRGKR